MTTLNQAAFNIMQRVEAFDRDCEASQYTDTDHVWAIFRDILGDLRPHMNPGQLAELAEMKARHEAEIEREEALAADHEQHAMTVSA